MVEHFLQGLYAGCRRRCIKEHEREKRCVVCCLLWQYELVAELFREDDDARPTAASSGKAKSTAAVVRASKVAQKSTQQLRQHKKTVGSQVSTAYTGWRAPQKLEHAIICLSLDKQYTMFSVTALHSTDCN